MAGELRINLLGSLTVTIGGQTAVFRTDAERVLLATLAAHQGVPQRRDTLAGLLSPDRPDKKALTYLRNRLTRLRKFIGDDTAVPPYLTIDRKQIALREGDDVQIDLIQFERALTAVETHLHRQLAGCPTCLARLETAVDLVRGELLAGLNFPSDTWEAWLTNRREHVQQRALEGMTWLREASAQQGEWTAVLDIAQRQLRFEPWLEAAHRAIMLAHAHLGDRTAALAQFEQCCQVLEDELGIEPEEETEVVRQQILAEALGEYVTAVPHNLPYSSGQFWGREAEQTLLLQRLVNPHQRLITLVGTGGIGKTRLAIEVGRQLKTSFPDGVWFISLEAVQGGAEQIKIAVGEALGLAQDKRQLTGEQVVTILREKQLLLILDNAEELLDDLVFLTEWLRRAPHIAILATSREPLNLQAEWTMMLDGLPVGQAEIDTAERLFAERGQMARDDFGVTAENLPLVRQICHLVDGSPLGISLAAAWVRRRSLGQIIDSIGQSLDFLSSRLRDVDPRHRSMRAVLETSWQLLTPDEQNLLAALAIFPASFTAVSAQAIAQATLFDLDTLCEKSLLQQEPEQERYTMHSLVRQFGVEKLGEQKTAVSQAFVNYFARYAQEHQTDYTALAAEWGNLLTAVVQAHALELWSTVVTLVQTLDEPWFRQIRFQEMRQGLTLAAEAAAALDHQSALARTLLRLGEIEVELNDYAAAEAHLNRAMPLLMRLEDGLGIAQGYYLNGRIKHDQSHISQAMRLFEQAATLFEEEGDPVGVAKNLNLMAVCTIKQRRDVEHARTFLERAVALQQENPPASIYVESLRYLARIEIMGQALDAAQSYLGEAIAVSEQLNDVGEKAAVLYEQLLLYKTANQIDDALSVGSDCLKSFQTLGSLRWEGLIKTQLGLLHQQQEAYPQAETFLTESVEIFEEVKDSHEQAYSYYYLYRLYAHMGQNAKSETARQNAQRLNATLNDPQLTERLQ